jgi:glycosyltransferase involved in cell wall biosynthesis
MLDVSSRFDLLGARDGAERDVVFTFSYVTWQAAAGRGWFMPEDRLARTLVSHPRVRRVLVCDLMRSLPVKLLRDVTTRPAVPFPAGERARQLRPVRLRRHDPTSPGGAERAVAAYARAMRRAVERMGLQDPVVITAHPLLAGFLDCDWAQAVTFYATDDWSAYPPHRRWWPVYRESFARVAQRGHRVAAVSVPVLERLAPTGPGAVIPNGLEPSEWIGDPAPPVWLSGLRRPLLLYAGSLDSRLDVIGLVAIARALPEATVLLVGPLCDPQHLLPLRAVANIEIRPALTRAAVTGLIRVADVGLIPHVRSPLTEAMSPLKLYEYLAGGLPVVATDLRPMRDVDPRVTLVADGEQYPAAVRAALQAGRAGEDERLTFVQTNSWAARHERLLELALA